MRRIAFLALAFIALSALAPAPRADETTRPLRVLGKKSRRQLRHELYEKRLAADKLRVFRKHGFTPYRLREDRGVAGLSERWRYPEAGLEFVFDAEGRLKRTRRIPVGDRVFD